MEETSARHWARASLEGNDGSVYLRSVKFELSVSSFSKFYKFTDTSSHSCAFVCCIKTKSCEPVAN